MHVVSMISLVFLNINFYKHFNVLTPVQIEVKAVKKTTLVQHLMMQSCKKDQ